MSYKTEQTWFYYLNGRSIQLYQRSDYGRTDTLGSYKIRLPDDSSGTYFIYPDEDITDGLRIEYTSLATPFVSEALEDMQVFEDGAIISFEDGTGGSSRDIIDFGSSTANDFAVSDKVRVIGSASNDGDYAVVAKGTDVSTGYQQLEVAAGSFTTEAVGESVTVYQIPVEDSSPDETSHINLNKMLSLACVDYVKAMLSDLTGDIQKKEYYMREFWKKIGDNDSNKRKIVMSYPIGTYAVR